MTGDSKPSAEDMDAAIAALSQHGDPLRPYQVEAVAKAIAERVNREPIPMVLHCPSCGAQHIDAPEPETGWDNPPHRSHSCRTCKTIWRPADVATTGVAAIATRGLVDNWTGFTVGDAFRNADEALNREIERRREAEADIDAMMVCAVRYCIGRQSYIVGTCDGWLRKRWLTLSAGTRDVILRDISRALEQERLDHRSLGMKIDIDTWGALYRDLSADPPNTSGER